jgi:hypothetical protein
MKSVIAASALLLLPATPALAQNEPGDAPDKPRRVATTAAPAGDTSMATIYNNALGSGWENWKWEGAESEVGVELGGSSRKPIRVEAQGYKGLYLHHAPFSTAPFKGISMLIQSIGGTGQIRLIAIAGGKPIEGKQKLVKLAPGGWTKIDVPLEALGAENVMIDGIWLQNDSGDPAPRFYVTEIMLH